MQVLAELETSEGYGADALRMTSTAEGADSLGRAVFLLMGQSALDGFAKDREVSVERTNADVSATAERRAGLKTVIRHVFLESHETNGHRRVHAMLQRMNVQAGPELVRLLMRELGLVTCQPRPWRLTTVADDSALSTPDLLTRDFTNASTRGSDTRPLRGPPPSHQPHQASCPKAIRAVRRWLTPWATLQRYWRAWTTKPPPTELQNLINAVSTGRPIALYTPV